MSPARQDLAWLVDEIERLRRLVAEAIDTRTFLTRWDLVLQAGTARTQGTLSAQPSWGAAVLA